MDLSATKNELECYTPQHLIEGWDVMRAGIWENLWEVPQFYTMGPWNDRVADKPRHTIDRWFLPNLYVVVWFTRSLYDQHTVWKFGIPSNSENLTKNESEKQSCFRGKEAVREEEGKSNKGEPEDPSAKKGCASKW